MITVAVRRYRCQRGGGITTVLPGGLCARRHYSASAIGLALCLFGLMRHSIGKTRGRMSDCSDHFGFNAVPFSKEIDDDKLWLPPSPLPVAAATRASTRHARIALCASHPRVEHELHERAMPGDINADRIIERAMALLDAVDAIAFSFTTHGPWMAHRPSQPIL